MTTVSILESKRTNEFRIPIHPEHFTKISRNRDKIYFQQDYASRLEQTKENLLSNSFNIDTRDKLLMNSDLVVLLKPTKTDLEKLKERSTIIGWCHAIQQIDIAKIAAKRKLTLIAMEEMYEDLLNYTYPRHLFYENNYLTGYEGVVHAFSNAPITYPKTAKIAIIAYGNVSYGAAVRLQELGYENITVFTRRKSNEIFNKLDNINYHTIIANNHQLLDNNNNLLNKTLKDFDIIINGIKQDPIHPYNFFSVEELKTVKGKLLIDLSCDENMGFEFSHETTWENPIILLYNNYYYAVPNIPSIVWEKASETISQKLMPIINAFLENIFTPEMTKMLEDATQIKWGEIINPKIIQYQEKLGFL